MRRERNIAAVHLTKTKPIEGRRGDTGKDGRKYAEISPRSRTRAFNRNKRACCCCFCCCCFCCCSTTSRTICLFYRRSEPGTCRCRLNTMVSYSPNSGEFVGTYHEYQVKSCYPAHRGSYHYNTKHSSIFQTYYACHRGIKYNKLRCTFMEVNRDSAREQTHQQLLWSV